MEAIYLWIGKIFFWGFVSGIVTVLILALAASFSMNDISDEDNK